MNLDRTSEKGRYLGRWWLFWWRHLLFQPSAPLLAARADVPGKSEAQVRPSGLRSAWRWQRWAGGKVSVLAVEAAGMAAMGEVGDAQAKNIHTAEKFERSVREVMAHWTVGSRISKAKGLGELWTCERVYGTCLWSCVT